MRTMMRWFRMKMGTPTEASDPEGSDAELSEADPDE
jgi:hypothetical protein